MSKIALGIMAVASLALASCGEEGTTQEPQDGMTAGVPAGLEDQTPAGEIEGPLHTGSGDITKIDGSRITISHGPVETMEWPAMTMTFEADAQILEQVSVGEGIAFEFRTGTEGSVVTSVTPR